MKNKILILLALACNPLCFADAVATQSPITMLQLMQKLDIRGGNWTFKFEAPVYAKITCSVSSYPDGEKTEFFDFVSDSPESIIDLYFMVSPSRLGEHPKYGEKFDKSMNIKLSNCRETSGTRLVHFYQKFSVSPYTGTKDGQEVGEFVPSVARNPILNKEYVLYYYYKTGDAYQVKATICFMKSLDDASKVDKFTGKGVRDFKQADE